MPILGLRYRKIRATPMKDAEDQLKLRKLSASPAPSKIMSDANASGLDMDLDATSWPVRSYEETGLAEASLLMVPEAA